MIRRNNPFFFSFLPIFRSMPIRDWRLDVTSKFKIVHPESSESLDFPFLAGALVHLKTSAHNQGRLGGGEENWVKFETGSQRSRPVSWLLESSLTNLKERKRELPGESMIWEWSCYSSCIFIHCSGFRCPRSWHLIASLP